MLYSLLYSSAETSTPTRQQLRELLAQSREFNAAHDITGLLLYYKHSFMQLLEGEKDVIVALFENKIFFDERHCAVTKYFEEPIEKRDFATWSMGFKLVDGENPSELAGFAPFIADGLNSPLLRENPSVAQEILLMFIDQNLQG